MTASSPATSTTRVLRAAALYFVIVFAVGFLLGPVRVLWVEPWLGKTIAVLVETPFLVVAMMFAATWAPRWIGVEGRWPDFLAIGVVALILQQVADLAVGFGLRGMTLSEQIAYFASPPGYIYAVTLIIFTLMPLWMRLRELRSES
jgi:hypothetical protein